MLFHVVDVLGSDSDQYDRLAKPPSIPRALEALFHRQFNGCHDPYRAKHCKCSAGLGFQMCLYEQLRLRFQSLLSIALEDCIRAHTIILNMEGL